MIVLPFSKVQSPESMPVVQWKIELIVARLPEREMAKIVSANSLRPSEAYMRQ